MQAQRADVGAAGREVVSAGNGAAGRLVLVNDEPLVIESPPETKALPKEGA